MERKIMEEDNLEQLRLEALSSMKKNTNREKMGNVIKVVESVNSQSNSHKHSFYFEDMNRKMNHIETLGNPNSEHLYIQPCQRVMSPYLDEDLSDRYSTMQPRNHSRVQLSPRSAAFVSDNNNILNLRKEGISPNRPRSPLTPPHRFKPGRWSKTPPPYKNGTRSTNYRKRSESRTPARVEKSSPKLTKFSLPDSKSPSLSSKDLRSPSHSKLRKSPFRDSSSGTPRRIQNDRLSSPHFSHKTPKTANSQKRHREYSPNRSFGRNKLNRRSRSQNIKIRRTRSRSHNRNLGSRSYRAERTEISKRRSSRSPQHNRKNKKETKKNRPTNRSPSPVIKTIVKQKLPELVVEEKQIPKTNEQLEEESKPSVVEEKKASNELIDENNSSDEDEVIDLYPTDESESENEGRFKCNSSSKSNTVGTVSFSKLGNNSSISAVSDLNDVNHNKNSTYTRKSRDDQYIRGSKNIRKDERPNRRYGGSRSDNHRYGDRQKSKYPSSVACVIPKSIDKLSYKATIQFVPNDLKSEIKAPPKSTVSSKIAPAVDRKRPRTTSDDDEIVEDAGNLSTKKSIHSRLGAPTWKNKKQWRSEKVSEKNLPHYVDIYAR